MSEKPFAETPDAEFLYLSLGHREGLAHLEFNILDGKGFSVLIGGVGTGKTTLCRALIDRLDAQKITVVHIIHTNLDFCEFLREVVEELGISSQGQQKWDLLKALNHYLIEAYGQNRKVVLIVDEAQNLEAFRLGRDTDAFQSGNPPGKIDPNCICRPAGISEKYGKTGYGPTQTKGCRNLLPGAFDQGGDPRLCGVPFE